MTNDTAQTHGFTLAWTLEASPADVFRVWTDPAEPGWFYNDGMRAPDEPIEVDLRVGGIWRQLMVENAEMTLQVDFPPHFSEVDVERWLALGIRQGWQVTIDRLVAISA